LTELNQLPTSVDKTLQISNVLTAEGPNGEPSLLQLSIRITETFAYLLDLYTTSRFLKSYQHVGIFEGKAMRKELLNN
jgi:hypothetical protein